jgi:hypothetical protein
MASSWVPRPVRTRGIGQSSRLVQVEVKQVDRPGKLGTLVPGGGQSERPKKETKRRGKRSTVGCEVRCISKVCEDGGCDDDIDVEARRIPRNKSGRQSGSALDWSWFQASISLGL